MPGCSDSRTKSRTVFASPLLLLALAAPLRAVAQSRGGAQPTPTIAMSWPREIADGRPIVTIYTPQVDRWDGAQIDMRAVMSVGHPTSPRQDFGVIWITARTLVDQVNRVVSIDAVQVVRASFPGQPENAEIYLDTLRAADALLMAAVRVAVADGGPELLENYRSHADRYAGTAMQAGPQTVAGPDAWLAGNGPDAPSPPASLSVRAMPPKRAWGEWPPSGPWVRTSESWPQPRPW
jgi:hypothetical protein